MKTAKDLFTRNFTVQEKAEVEHQAMMKAVIDAKFVKQEDKRWLGKWGKMLKLNRELNGFCPEHLEKIISKGKKLEADGKANARGFVRNRLQKADWRKWL